MIINPCKYVKGEITIPGDKSISHRAIMLGSIAEGITEIDNFLFSEDCLNTINCFQKMGVQIEINSNKIKIFGGGLYLKPPIRQLYVGNSGTTIRIVSGILAGQKFSSIIDGDSSIRKRPMDRIVKPLSLMGANIAGINDKYAPLKITESILKGIEYFSAISSAQVKSCILLASLYASSPTIYSEPIVSRNHTEIMLKYFGGNIDIYNNKITCKPVSKIYGQHIYVPGDISSAAFFMVLGLITPQSEITIKNIGINPTRTGVIDVLKKMGGKIELQNVKILNNEPSCDLTVTTSELRGITIDKNIIPRIIDEIPILAIAATQAYGKTIIKDASELRFKETDRIKALVSELSKMNANIIEIEDGIIIEGTSELKGANVKSYNDHRIAMTLSIAAKIAHGKTTMSDAECVNTSFPRFYEMLNRVCEM